MKNPNQFWNKVKITDLLSCWLWLGARDKSGYGRLRWRGAFDRAHRVAYSIAIGSIPAGQHVLHSCDNPACTNPSHLFLGTPQDNMVDMAAKDRACHGIQIHNARLTPSKVRLIRPSRNSNVVLARQFDVNTSTIHRVRARQIWRHVT